MAVMEILFLCFLLTNSLGAPDVKLLTRFHQVPTPNQEHFNTLEKHNTQSGGLSEEQQTSLGAIPNKNFPVKLNKGLLDLDSLLGGLLPSQLSSLLSSLLLRGKNHETGSTSFRSLESRGSCSSCEAHETNSEDNSHEDEQSEGSLINLDLDLLNGDNPLTDILDGLLGKDHTTNTDDEGMQTDEDGMEHEDGEMNAGCGDNSCEDSPADPPSEEDESPSCSSCEEMHHRSLANDNAHRSSDLNRNIPSNTDLKPKFPFRPTNSLAYIGNKRKKRQIKEKIQTSITEFNEISNSRIKKIIEKVESTSDEEKNRKLNTFLQSEKGNIEDEQVSDDKVITITDDSEENLKSPATDDSRSSRDVSGLENTANPKDTGREGGNSLANSNNDSHDLVEQDSLSNSNSNLRDGHEGDLNNDNNKRSDDTKTTENESLGLSKSAIRKNYINNANPFMRDSLNDIYLQRILRELWPYLYTNYKEAPIFVRTMLSNKMSKRSPSLVPFNRQFIQPHYSQIPQSIAGSSLLGSYAFAHTRPFPSLGFGGLGGNEIPIGEGGGIVTPGGGEEIIEG